VGDSAADEYHSFGNDVGTYQSTADTDQQRTDQRILKKIIF